MKTVMCLLDSSLFLCRLVLVCFYSPPIPTQRLLHVSSATAAVSVFKAFRLVCVFSRTRCDRLSWHCSMQASKDVLCSQSARYYLHSQCLWGSAPCSTEALQFFFVSSCQYVCQIMRWLSVQTLVILGIDSSNQQSGNHPFHAYVLEVYENFLFNS